MAEGDGGGRLPLPSDGDGDGDNPNKDRSLQDHVLCALFAWFESGTKEDVKKIAISVFSFEEIKDSLIKFCDPVTVVGTTKPKNLQKPETCFDEIWSQLVKLHTAKHLPMVVVDRQLSLFQAAHG